MRRLTQFILAIAVISAVGCGQRRSGLDLQDELARSLPHDASIRPPDVNARFTSLLTAEGTNWNVTVQWNVGDLKRFVTWREVTEGFSLGIPLRTRPEPFTQSFWGLTITQFGPYQPACVHHRKGADWHVQMSHEQTDFPTEGQLMEFLKRSVPGQPHANPVLSPNGTMVWLYGPSYSGTRSLDVRIWILTVNGRKPSPELLKPFLRGKITEEPNNGVVLTGDPLRGSPAAHR